MRCEESFFGTFRVLRLFINHSFFVALFDQQFLKVNFIDFRSNNRTEAAHPSLFHARRTVNPSDNVSVRQDRQTDRQTCVRTDRRTE